MVTPEIVEYYERGGETARLSEGLGRLEFLRTWDILTRELPPHPARILDVGGATGVYAAPLAALGHDVTVIDPVPGHVAASARLPGVTAIEGDARSLPVGDGEADVVLMLGPLYHLPERADRIAAWREARRAARPGGLVAGVVICRFASLFDGAVKGYYAEPGFRELVEDVLVDGRHRSGERGLPYFTDAYFHRPEEPAAEAAEAGLGEIRTVAVEGPLWMTGGLPSGPALEMLRRVEHEPSIQGASSHLMTITRNRP
jgi:SAM-dependent methyltransferase